MVSFFFKIFLVGTTELKRSLGKYCSIMAVIVIATLQIPTLPNQFSIPFPNTVEGTRRSPALGHLTPTPNPDTY